MCTEGTPALPWGTFLLLDHDEMQGVLTEGLGKLRWGEDIWESGNRNDVFKYFSNVLSYLCVLVNISFACGYSVIFYCHQCNNWCAHEAQRKEWWESFHGVSDAWVGFCNMNRILAKKLSGQNGSTWVRTLVCETEDMTGWLRDLGDFVLGDCEHRSAIGRAGKKRGRAACLFYPSHRGGKRYRGRGCVSGGFYFYFRCSSSSLSVGNMFQDSSRCLKPWIVLRFFPVCTYIYICICMYKLHLQ